MGVGSASILSWGFFSSGRGRISEALILVGLEVMVGMPDSLRYWFDSGSLGWG